MYSYADASSFQCCVGSGYFASRGKNSPSGYFAASAEIALSPEPNANPNPNRGKTLLCL